jgi:hypothetical protein
MKKVIAVIALASVALTGCLDKDEFGKSGNIQKESCMFNELGKASTSCKEGQLAVFLPGSWGNEQYPILAASQFCDFRYQIVYNNGGVSCIYTGQRLEKKAEEKK